MSPQPDSAELTAYALGELEESERIAVAAKLIRSEASRQYVAEVRQLADEIVAGLSREPSPALTDEQRRTVERRIAEVTRARPVRLRGSRVWAVPLAAAACLVVGVVSYGLGQYFAPANRAGSTMEAARGGSEAPVVEPSEAVVGAHLSPVLPVSRQSPMGREGRSPDLVISTPDTRTSSGVDLLPARERRFQPPGAPWPESAPFVAVARVPVSRVRAGSGTEANVFYSALAEDVKRGALPEPEKIELDVLFNHFAYRHTDVVSNEAFSVQADVVPSPYWNSHLVLVGVRGKAAEASEADVSDIVARDLDVELAFDAGRVHSYRWLGSSSTGEESAAPDGEPTSLPVSSDFRLAALCEVVASASVRENGAARQVYNSSVPPGTELMRIRLSYLPPSGEEPRSLSVPVRYAGEQLATAPRDFKFALAVCGWGLTLKSLARAAQRDGAALPREPSLRLDLLRNWAEEGLGPDPEPDRSAFVELLKETAKLEGDR